MLTRSTVVAARAVKRVVARHAAFACVKNVNPSASLQPSVARIGSVRCLSSSSRFLSLADDDGEGKQRRGEDGEDGEEGGDVEEGEEGEKDGDLELEEFGMYEFCVEETEDLDREIMELYMSNPLKWTPMRIARRFHLSTQRVEATIIFEAEAAGLTQEEFKLKVEQAKEAAAQKEQEGADELASAEARGDTKEVQRLQKRGRQQQRALDDADHEELTEAEELAVLGLEDDSYRNPDFFFLSDEFEGYPPLTRRMGKHKFTDKLYPEEALEVQRLATKNKITQLKSFAKPTDKQNRWKFAIKDTSKNKLPLLMRDQDHSLRLATNEEVLPRTWVRRPPFFSGVAK